MSTTVRRRPIRFYSDPKRVIVRFFFPGPETRVLSIIQKVIEMPEEAAALTLRHVLRDFSGRHRNISRIFQKHFDRTSEIMNGRNGDLTILSISKKLLIGAFFSSEYSIESAAFFNPSMVEDPDQTGLQDKQKRVIISFRATGEGHISSIAFRGGILDADNNLELLPSGRIVDEPETVYNFVYNKDFFSQKLCEIYGVCEIPSEGSALAHVFGKLRQEFDYNELYRAIDETKRELNLDDDQRHLLKLISWIGESYYRITFSLDTGISDRVIFPFAAAESNGIEDARFVKFTDDDGISHYCATYTAYNGVSIMPMLLETKNFYEFTIKPIHGENAQNKGMALFPRKIRGMYVMLSRIDGINNYIMFSDTINHWQDAVPLQTPKFPWEFIQVGNCGSPIETEFGWLVITHGVGPMRRYAISAILLDLEDPTKLIGQLNEPLLLPNEEERDGYVPNVVYSCGSIINNNELVLPYAMSDTTSTFATFSLKEILTNLLPSDLKKGRPSAEKSKARILVIDDEVTNQRDISRILKKEGYDIDIAPDGVIALMQIAKEKFDLILCDIAMPNIDGYQMLEYMNNNAIEIPLIFLSDLSDSANKAKGMRMGAAEYIQKPIDKNLLLLLVDKVLKSRLQAKD
ncbi:MAG: response regulator [Prolixibacteraceae bacterium]